MKSFIIVMLFAMALAASAVVIDQQATEMDQLMTPATEEVQEQEQPAQEQEDQEMLESEDVSKYMDTRDISIQQMERELAAHGLTNEDVEDVMALHRIQEDARETGESDIMDSDSRDERAQRMVHRLYLKALKTSAGDEQEQVEDRDTASPHFRYFKDSKGYHAGELSLNPTKKWLRYVYMSGIVYDRVKPFYVGEIITFRRRYFWKDLKMKVLGRYSPGRGTQAMVLEDVENKVIHSLFRGSEASSFREFYHDWVATDANAFLDPCRINGYSAPGECHRGFIKAFNELGQGYHSLLKSYHRKGWSMAFTGHSLGGALANLAAYHFKEHANMKIHRVVTFGAPRVGDASFAREFNRKLGSVSFQFVNSFSTAPCVKISFGGDEQVSDDDSARQTAMRFMLKNPQYYRDWLNEAREADQVESSDASESDNDSNPVFEIQDQDQDKFMSWGSWLSYLPKLTTSSGRKGQDLVSQLPPLAVGYSDVDKRDLVKCPRSCSSFCCGMKPDRVVARVSCHMMEDYYGAMGGDTNFA
eukprot:TRINITY_DN5401_c0_g2_i22.p1 TRINITY_DN5401_c0_g2~~TRINITY_DN5401_c0_g2_i22.p1  ORF type:complete len:547 (+),score=150.98 TRINITY_DN5401_c0_g2_i22:53-1642(+)